MMTPLKRVLAALPILIAVLAMSCAEQVQTVCGYGGAHTGESAMPLHDYDGVDPIHAPETITDKGVWPTTQVPDDNDDNEAAAFTVAMEALTDKVNYLGWRTESNIRTIVGTGNQSIDWQTVSNGHVFVLPADPGGDPVEIELVDTPPPPQGFRLRLLVPGMIHDANDRYHILRETRTAGHEICSIRNATTGSPGAPVWFADLVFDSAWVLDANSGQLDGTHGVIPHEDAF